MILEYLQGFSHRKKKSRKCHPRWGTEEFTFSILKALKSCGSVVRAPVSQLKIGGSNLNEVDFFFLFSPLFSMGAGGFPPIYHRGAVSPPPPPNSEHLFFRNALH